MKSPAPITEAKKSNTKIKFIFSLGVLLVLTGAWFWFPITLTYRMHNGIFYVTRYPVTKEKWDHPRLKEFREKEKLDQVVASGKTEFEKQILLRHWVHQQWKGEGQFYYPPWDALEILRLARQYNNRPFCAQYAIVYLQACLALGIHARYVDLPGHFTVEVWSNELNRWVIQDPTYDHYYEIDHIPARGIALCKAYWDKKWDQVEKIQFDGTRARSSKDDLKIYRMFSIVLRTNHLSEPILISVNAKPPYPLTLQQDYRNYPKVGRDSIGFGDDFIQWEEVGETDFFVDKAKSHDLDDFTAAVNQTIISEANDDAPPGLYKLRLNAENSPTFQTFLIQIDNGEWQGASHNILWTLHPGINTIAARIRTQYGWLGPISSMKVYYKPRRSLGIF